MLFPHTHAWTPIQRWFVVAAGIAVLILFSALVYSYERYYRGPGESALYGTWQVPDFPSDEPVYFQFNPDQTFSMCSVFEGKLSPFTTGRWYAGGPNIYLRFSADGIREARPLILHIVDIQAEEFRVRYSRDGRVVTYRRAHLDSPSASNQAMQRTRESSRSRDLVSR
jgi:hypothetical protein